MNIIGPMCETKQDDESTQPRVYAVHLHPSHLLIIKPRVTLIKEYGMSDWYQVRVVPHTQIDSPVQDRTGS